MLICEYITELHRLREYKLAHKYTEKQGMLNSKIALLYVLSRY